MDQLKKLDDLKEYALSLGAIRAEIIPTSKLVVREAARAKCYIPACKFYGSSIMCPPHNPLTPDITRKIVSEFSWGLIFQVKAKVEDFVGPNWRTGHLATELAHKEMLARIEGRAFHSGMHMAMGFAAGECSLCLPKVTCAILEGEECRHPLRARPAMEACGFDVFTIVDKIGWEMVPIGHESEVKSTPCASLVGLVLAF